MSEPVLTPGKWITIRRYKPQKPRKTKCYAILPDDGSSCIGTIEWYSPWRGYAFFPRPHRITFYFEQIGYKAPDYAAGYHEMLRQARERAMEAQDDQ